MTDPTPTPTAMTALVPLTVKNHSDTPLVVKAGGEADKTVQPNETVDVFNAGKAG